VRVKSDMARIRLLAFDELLNARKKRGFLIVEDCGESRCVLVCYFEVGS
jgi:hypothetical protein